MHAVGVPTGIELWAAEVEGLNLGGIRDHRGQGYWITLASSLPHACKASATDLFLALIGLEHFSV